METEREKNLRRIFDLVERRASPGFGKLTFLSDEKEKREARSRRKRERRLVPSADPGRKNSGGSDSKE